MSLPRVLVIEDDDLARAALVRQLQQLGPALIEESSDGHHARECLERGTFFDLVCCDLLLPGVDGVEVLRALGGRHASAGVILVSALDERVLRSVAVSCRERGIPVLGALRKPVRSEALARHVGDRIAQRPPVATAAPQWHTRVADAERALEQRSICARAQPVLNAVDGRLVSVELLAHWPRNAGTAVSGAQLCRLLEGSGVRLSRYMIGLALRTAKEWREQGIDVPLSVNIDDGALGDLEFPEFVDHMLRAMNIPGEQLAVEVGEGMALDHADALDVLARLRMRGVKVVLDNFGKGPIAVSRALRMPLTEIKIDRSFVRGLPDNAVGRAVIEFACRLSTSLGVTATAVGIEDEKQRETAVALGCTRLQGYSIAHPMDPAKFPDWARQHQKAAKNPAPSVDPPTIDAGQLLSSHDPIGSSERAQRVPIADGSPGRGHTT